jgi:oligoribonuclease
MVGARSTTVLSVQQIFTSLNFFLFSHFLQSGLTQKVKESTISLKEAETAMTAFIRKYTVPGMSPLCGNSVYMDKRFLEKYMPRFSDQLHYRIIDVSTVKELCRRWYPETYQKATPKAGGHRALADIKESIEEHKFYRINIFK